MKQQKNSHVVAVRDEKRSRPWDVRFVLVDTDSGKVVDDAHGWGYHTPDNAYASWRWQCRTLGGQNSRDQLARKEVRRFRTSHKEFMDQLKRRIKEGGCDVPAVGQMLREAGFRDLDFTAADLLRFGLG